MESIKWPLLITANILALTLIFAYRSTVKKFFDRYYKIMIWLELVAAFIFGSFLVYETSSALQKFFGDYKDVFTGIGYSSVAVGLIFTWVQVRAAKKRARANSSYQIHKDGREILSSIKDEGINYITGADPASTQVKIEAERKIREILMYFAAVHHQWTFGNIDDEFFERVILNEFCEFLRHDRVEDYWNNNIANVPELWGEEFIRMGQKCFS